MLNKIKQKVKAVVYWGSGEATAADVKALKSASIPLHSFSKFEVRHRWGQRSHWQLACLCVLQIINGSGCWKQSLPLLPLPLLAINRLQVQETQVSAAGSTPLLWHIAWLCSYPGVLITKHLM